MKRKKSAGSARLAPRDVLIVHSEGDGWVKAQGAPSIDAALRSLGDAIRSGATEARIVPVVPDGESAEAIVRYNPEGV